MNEKIKTTIQKIKLLAEQNPEFDLELKKLVSYTPANPAIENDKRINEIHEYCIERTIRKQAEEFYSNFPLTSLTPKLKEDYIRMESFRRRDNFEDFCLALYQQIEFITNHLCENSDLEQITSKMWDCHAYTLSNDFNNQQPKGNISRYPIAQLIFYGNDKDTGEPNYKQQKKNPLKSLSAYQKIRVVIYFIGYNAKFRHKDYDPYVEFTNSMYDIYQCRNMNHRGGPKNEKSQAIYCRILPLKSFYYFKFLGTLAQYVECIKKGIPHIPDLKEFCETTNNLQGFPKIIGKIILNEEDTKRF